MVLHVQCSAKLTYRMWPSPYRSLCACVRTCRSAKRSIEHHCPRLRFPVLHIPHRFLPPAPFVNGRDKFGRLHHTNLPSLSRPLPPPPPPSPPTSLSYPHPSKLLINPHTSLVHLPAEIQGVVCMSHAGNYSARNGGHPVWVLLLFACLFVITLFFMWVWGL